MTTAPLPKFVNQDLRLRSFRYQNLQGVGFSGCDLRGCDFQGADLQQAFFTACRTGHSRQRWLMVGTVTGVLALLMLQAIGSMSFAALGTLPEDPARPYVIGLYVALGIAATSAGIKSWQLPLTKTANRLAGISTGALLGFFYGGSLTDNNPVIAIVGAVALGIGGILIARPNQTTLVTATLSIMGAISAYGFSFGLWETASNLFTTGAILRGIPWGILSLLYIGVTLRSTADGLQSAREYAITSFRRANLTGCTFTETEISKCDLREAIAL